MRFLLDFFCYCFVNFFIFNIVYWSCYWICCCPKVYLLFVYMLVLGLLVIFIGSSIIFINIEITFVPLALLLFPSSFLVGTRVLTDYVSNDTPDAVFGIASINTTIALCATCLHSFVFWFCWIFGVECILLHFLCHCA